MTCFRYVLAKETLVSPHQTHLGIVVGVDGSPSSTLGVEWAARDADMRNVPIKLVHIVAPIVAAAEGWSDIPAPSDYTRWQEDHARQLIEEAHKLAVEASSPSRASQVTSEVLHAWSDMGPLKFPSTNRAPIEWANIKVREEEVLAERLSGWRNRYPDVAVNRIVVCDRPAPRLLEQAENAQLVVVGEPGPRWVFRHAAGLGE